MIKIISSTQSMLVGPVMSGSHGCRDHQNLGLGSDRVRGRLAFRVWAEEYLCARRRQDVVKGRACGASYAVEWIVMAAWVGGHVVRVVRGARMRRIVTRKGGEGMDVLLVCDAGVERHDTEELPRLLERRDAVVWVDIAVCDQQAVNVLSGVFGFHPIAVRDCTERNHVSKVHIYPDYVFSVLHAPKLGKRGHVHYVELDQFVGPNYLVTVHGPLNPAVAPEVAFLDTATVIRRVEGKQLRMASPFELSYGIVSAMIRRESDLIADLAKESGLLEQRVMIGEDLEDPEAFLEELFQAWYVLLAARTIATHSSATYGRMARGADPGAWTRTRPAAEILAPRASPLRPAGAERDHPERREDRETQPEAGVLRGDFPVHFLLAHGASDVLVDLLEFPR
jgi:hypothetical protein